MKIIIMGAGGHAQVIADALLERRALGEPIEIVGFLDDDMALKGKQFIGIPVLGKIEEYQTMQFDHFVVGIGDNKIRERVFNTFQTMHYKPFAVIHPRSVIAKNVIIGEGTVVFAGSVINTGSTIGSNSIINTGATIDHHAVIGAHVHIAPGVHLGGTVSIEEGSFLGIGTNVIPNLTIGAWSVIGAGSTVIQDIQSNITVVGTPAKIIKEHKK